MLFNGFRQVAFCHLCLLSKEFLLSLLLNLRNQFLCWAIYKFKQDTFTGSFELFQRQCVVCSFSFFSGTPHTIIKFSRSWIASVVTFFLQLFPTGSMVNRSFAFKKLVSLDEDS